MFSAFPRLALQMRVREPGPLPHYAALDGYPWCTRTSCKMNYIESFGTIRRWSISIDIAVQHMIQYLYI